MGHLIYLVILFPFLIQSKMEFVGKTQVCTNRYVINTEWRLQLLPDSKFNYRISEFDSQKFHLGIKNDTVIYEGTWMLLRDTLILSSSGLNDYCKKDIKYYKKTNKLFSLGSCIDSTDRGASIAFLEVVKRKK
jgi:hypothetical protein